MGSGPGGTRVEVLDQLKWGCVLLDTPFEPFQAQKTKTQ